MTAENSSPDANGQPARPTHRDPLSSDRRVLTIGVVAMIVFVAIGFGSAQVFTGSACSDLRTEFDTAASGAFAQPASFAHEAPVASSVAVEITDERLVALAMASAGVELDAADVEFLTADALLAELTGKHRAQGLRLAALSDGGLALIAQDTHDTRVLLVDAAGEGLGELDWSRPVRVVGGGDRLYALAHANDLTGQLDAFTALAVEPGAGNVDISDCVDTALVGFPLAFYLDDPDGSLLLLRVDEDGGDAHIERRVGVAASWRASLAVPTTPAGTLAQRVVARVVDVEPTALVVAARRYLTDDGAPIVAAFDATDGEAAWQIGQDNWPVAADGGAVHAAVLADPITIAVIDDAGGNASSVVLDPTGQVVAVEPFDATHPDWPSRDGGVDIGADGLPEQLAEALAGWSLVDGVSQTVDGRATTAVLAVRRDGDDRRATLWLYREH